MKLTAQEVVMLMQRVRQNVGEQEYRRLTIGEVLDRYRVEKWRYLGERKLTA